MIQLGDRVRIKKGTKDVKGFASGLLGYLVTIDDTPGVEYRYGVKFDGHKTIAGFNEGELEKVKG